MIKKIIWPLAGVAVGALAGYLYWYYVSCTGGSCPIYSVWWRSTLYGAIMGGLLFSLFEDILSKYSRKEKS